MRRRVGPITLALALALALALTMISGCAAPVTLPAGVTVDARQTRFDAPLRQVQLSVVNDSEHPLTVLRAELDSTRFEASVAFERSQIVPAGASRDLPVRLAAPVCHGGREVDLVHLEFAGPDGRPATATLPIADTAVLDQITAEDCFVAAVEAIASITGPIEAVWTPGARSPAILEFTVQPTGSAGRLTIRDVGATTLFSHVDERGDRLTATPVNLVVDGDGPPSVVTLRLEPSRCDPHAIAEDKKGTILPFAIVIDDGPSGTLDLAVSPEVRASLYDYVTAWCSRLA